MIGRVAEKGFDDFCTIADKFRLKKDFKFFWFGEVAEKNLNQTRSLAERKNVSYEGFVKDIYGVYSMANVLLFTSKYREGVPRAVLEAMAMKVPVVAYPIPGVTDVITSNRNGFLADSLNCNSLKVSLENALNSHDEVLKKIVDGR